ncbi:helix-turn-helix domain-containing protein [Clostridium sporogenes]
MTLKKHRQKSGLKVKKIAECLGISRVHYYNLENGTTTIDLEKLEKLSNLFRISIIDLEKAIREGKDERCN